MVKLELLLLVFGVIEMLVPSSFQPLVSENSCFMGVSVMGGVVNQFAQSLVMMSHCKFLGSAHYTIAKDTHDNSTNTTIFTNWNGAPKGLNKLNKVYQFFFASTQLSEFVGVIFQYVATRESSTNDPSIRFGVHNLAGTLLSKRVLFEFPQHLQMSDTTVQEVPYTATSGAIFYEAPTGTSGTDEPRPLFIPSANRGDMLIIEVEVTDCDLVQLDIFDLYQPEVTP